MSDLPWEDALLERKVQSDLKDLLKTMVAFANSVAPGHVATILVGERDDGTIQGVDNPDKIQKQIRSRAESIYPPILWQSEVYEAEEKFCIRVEIQPSGDTPHFGAPGWVRRGSETIKASDELFQRLIEVRLSKVRELAKWIGKVITVTPDIEQPATMLGAGTGPIQFHPRLMMTTAATLTIVNQFWATFQIDGGGHSEPLRKLTISWDDDNNRLQLLVGI